MVYTHQVTGLEGLCGLGGWLRLVPGANRNDPEDGLEADEFLQAVHHLCDLVDDHDRNCSTNQALSFIERGEVHSNVSMTRSLSRAKRDRLHARENYQRESGVKVETREEEEDEEEDDEGSEAPERSEAPEVSAEEYSDLMESILCAAAESGELSAAKLARTINPSMSSIFVDRQTEDA